MTPARAMFAMEALQGAHPKSVEGMWCGCGQPWAVWDLVRRALDALAPRSAPVADHQPGHDFFNSMDPGMAQILDGVLDRLGLTEHGSSFYGSWLTERGKWLQRAWSGLDADGIEAAYDAVADGPEAAGCYMDDTCPGCAALEVMP